MTRISVSTDLDASPARVWEILEPVENHVDWMQDAVAIRFVDDQRRGVGTTFDCDTKVGPFHLVDRMEITEWEPGAAMGVRHTGIVTGAGRFELVPIDLGRRTRFTWSETLHFPWYLGGRVTELLGGRVVMRAIWRRNLRALAELISRAPSAPR